MKVLGYHSDATAELDDAMAVYEQQREGRGVRFRRAVERAEKEIQRSLKAAPKY